MQGSNLGFIISGACVVAILVVAIRHNLFKNIDDMMTAIRIGGHNVEYQLFPDRSKPLTYMDKEVWLRQLYPDFFNKFNKEKWGEFWNVIYGPHPLINFDNKMLQGAERNYYILTETQKALAERYPELFSNFGDEHWKVFFKVIFGVLDPSSLGIPSSDDFSKELIEKGDKRLERKLEKDAGKIDQTVQRVIESTR